MAPQVTRVTDVYAELGYTAAITTRRRGGMTDARWNINLAIFGAGTCLCALHAPAGVPAGVLGAVLLIAALASWDAARSGCDVPDEAPETRWYESDDCLRGL
jgi:hypothetical protein